jgi:hypothetical protein
MILLKMLYVIILFFSFFYMETNLYQQNHKVRAILGQICLKQKVNQRKLIK